MQCAVQIEYNPVTFFVLDNVLEHFGHVVTRAGPGLASLAKTHCRVSVCRKDVLLPCSVQAHRLVLLWVGRVGASLNTISIL
jgi:hypothetical protein